MRRAALSLCTCKLVRSLAASWDPSVCWKTAWALQTGHTCSFSLLRQSALCRGSTLRKSCGAFWDQQATTAYTATAPGSSPAFHEPSRDVRYRLVSSPTQLVRAPPRVRHACHGTPLKGKRSPSSITAAGNVGAEEDKE